MSKWSLRYAAEIDEETLNRWFPTTSSEFGMNRNNHSAQKHLLHKPVGKLNLIMTTVNNYPNNIHYYASMHENKHIFSAKSTEWESQVNEALRQHFLKKPIVLPNQDNLHDPVNHAEMLHRVKEWVAYQI